MSDHWPLIPLADITHRITKGTTPTSVGGRFTDEGINYFKVESVAPDGALVRDKLAFIDDKTNEILRRSQLAVDDVLFSIAGAIGRTYLVREADLPANTNQALAIVRFDKSKVVPRYAFYAMRQYAFQGDALGRVVQTAQANVNLTQLSNAKLVLPSLTEQQGIVDLVGTYDDLIENNRRRMALLEEAARQLYREWFVRLHFPGFEHTRIIDGMPEGWEDVSASEILDINPKEKIEKGSVATYVPMSSLPESGMTVERGDFEQRTKHTSIKFRNGDTLFARITPSLENGKTGFADFLGEDEVACGSTEIIVLRGSAVSRYFTYCLTRTYDFRENAIKSMIGSSGRQRVQISCFAKFRLPLPPKLLREDFDRTAASCFRQIKNLADQNHQLRAARDLLLPRMMNGTVSV